MRRLCLEIRGAVQGVGFRPFVYRLAHDLNLTGWVINDTHGVCIEVEGPPHALDRFLERLPSEKPSLAFMLHLQAEWHEPAGYERFEIRHSDDQGGKSVLMLPDIAPCADCLRELFDPSDRRYRYPFINCTNCGPRFTIIQALPYDRPHTTMKPFRMCERCQKEYDDPSDRRFHAQPDACPMCGPHVTLWGQSGECWQAVRSGDDALRETVAALRDGSIVAVKGVGGFHLMADARNEPAVARLRERKPRRDKPFALMVRDLEQAAALCVLSPAAEATLTSPESPILLLPEQKHPPSHPLASNIAPGVSTLGIMLPSTPLHHLLLQAFDAPLVATSGNLSDEPICTDEHEAVQRLGHVADWFLVHNRPIARHTDDSIAWVVEGEPRLLRRARGYAPLPVLVPRRLPTILAVGAHLKNTAALSVMPQGAGRSRAGAEWPYTQVFLSQHIGDLETPEALEAFERVIADFLRLYEAQPVAIAHDMHPDYRSTHRARQMAQAHSLATIAVQHHHAHLAACLADHGTEGPALGVTWDGTGYGPDGTVWGGEFLLGDAAGFARVAHLRPFRLPGGDAAVKEPRRTALALLWEYEGATALERDDLLPVQAFSATERRVLAQMLRRGLNAPVTSSAGRLFDGIAALIGLHPHVSFEGQAAIALESLADHTVSDAYPLPLTNSSALPSTTATDTTPAPLIIDWLPLLDALVQDLRRSVSPAIMSARFHNALVEAVLAVAQRVAEPRVALTGGCFQNRLLLERASQRLQAAGFAVLLHRQVPPNDGGISLGQVVVAAQRTGENGEG